MDSATIKNFLEYRFGLLKDKFYDFYFKLCPLWKTKRIRNKQTAINVVFLLYDLATWKSEDLYLAMLHHKRFNPILAITRNIHLKGHEQDVLTYLQEKKYDFIILDETKTILKQIPTDILIDQRPYDEVPKKHRYYRNKGALIVYLAYGCHSFNEDWAVNTPITLRAWQDYFENDLCASSVRLYARNKGKNAVITGNPNLDVLSSRKKEDFYNPWKNSDCRKRIIWAPHHTIGDIHLEGIKYGTFLDVADEMLDIAKQYREKICFAFKPHPQLYKNLLEVWGQERTDAYYEKWKSMENSQFENGEYMGLFKHSDAMIHDCATFTMEYLATGNPALYLDRVEHKTDNLNECAKRSFELQYHGKTIDDIRHFIDNVIVGVDPRKEERMEFVNHYLRPPYGKTACENIMNAILGVEEYKS